MPDPTEPYEQPDPGWPGPCHEVACDGAVHPCPDVHNGLCERSTPADGCPCDDEASWCPHPECFDRAHGDGTHTDEDGRPFRGARPDEPTPIYDQLVAEQTHEEPT
jgi:hypothetical protein